MQAAFFLDRDGVLNRSLVRDGKPFAPRCLEDFEILPGVETAVARIKAAGYLAVVVTNQPDVGNGKVKREVVDEMHHTLRARLPVDDVLSCFHPQTAGCGCRKPKPGMLLEAARRFDIALERSVMVGDRASDIAAGAAVGCTTVFIDAGYREPAPLMPDYTVSSLLEAVTQLILNDCALGETT